MVNFTASTGFVLMAALSSTFAFVPSSIPSKVHTPYAFGVARTTTSGTTTFLSAEPEKAVMDDNFDDVDLVRLLGLQRVKNIIRRHKRESATDAPTQAAAPTTKKVTPAPVTPPSPAAPTTTTPVDDSLKLIIAGAPASGKGTQCEIIQQKFGVVHLSTGDMLRAAVAAQSEVGKAAQEAMDAGKLVSDEIIIGVVKDRLDQDDCRAKGWLLDGFPRTRAQADALASAGVSADCFLFLNVPDAMLVERVVGRRTDPDTGKIYHMTFSPPDDEAVLARLEQRSDDTEEKVVVRLEQFHANVAAVKGCYTDISVEIDGTSKPVDVAAAITEALKVKCGSKVSSA